MENYTIKVYLKSGQVMDLACYYSYLDTYQQVTTALTDGSEYIKIDNPNIPLYTCIKTCDVSGVIVERKRN